MTPEQAFPADFVADTLDMPAEVGAEQAGLLGEYLIDVGVNHVQQYPVAAKQPLDGVEG